MKKLLFLAIALFTFIASYAQQPPQRGPRQRMGAEEQAKFMVENLNKELKLTEAQQKELKAYFIDSAKKREESFKPGMGREAMMNLMKKSMEETNAKLKKVLTEEQYKTYQANQEKRRQARPQGGNPGNRGGSFPRN